MPHPDQEVEVFSEYGILTENPPSPGSTKLFVSLMAIFKFPTVVKILGLF